MRVAGAGRKPRTTGGDVGPGARASYLQQSASAPGRAVLTAFLLFASQLAIPACSSGGLTSRESASGGASRPIGDPVRRNASSDMIMNRKLAQRFPGAILLD